MQGGRGMSRGAQIGPATFSGSFDSATPAAAATALGAASAGYGAASASSAGYGAAAYGTPDASGGYSAQAAGYGARGTAGYGEAAGQGGSYGTGGQAAAVAAQGAQDAYAGEYMYAVRVAVSALVDKEHRVGISTAAQVQSRLSAFRWGNHVAQTLHGRLRRLWLRSTVWLWIPGWIRRPGRLWGSVSLCWIWQHKAGLL
jgi:hypothetical protein